MAKSSNATGVPAIMPNGSLPAPVFFQTTLEECLLQAGTTM
jgi:hypothetical protein